MEVCGYRYIVKPTKYLSVKEVAGILGLSDKTIYKLLHKGLIKGVVSFGSIHRIDEDIFLADLKSRATRSLKKVSESGNRHNLR